MADDRAPAHRRLGAGPVLLRQRGPSEKRGGQRDRAARAACGDLDCAEQRAQVHSSKSGNGNPWALVRFALPQIPAGCQITSAKLRLYSGSYKEGRTLQAFRLATTFIEGGVNWGSQPATSGSAANASSRTTAGYVEWTVTAQTQAMYSGSNTGFLIRDASGLKLEVTRSSVGGSVPLRGGQVRVIVLPDHQLSGAARSRRTSGGSSVDFFIRSAS